MTIIKEYIAHLEQLKSNYIQTNSSNEYQDGRNCAIDCIHDGIDCRINMLLDLLFEEDITESFVSCFFMEIIKMLINSLTSCMKFDNTSYNQGFNDTINDFCSKVTVYI